MSMLCFQSFQPLNIEIPVVQCGSRQTRDLDKSGGEDRGKKAIKNVTVYVVWSGVLAARFQSLNFRQHNPVWFWRLGGSNRDLQNFQDVHSRAQDQQQYVYVMFSKFSTSKHRDTPKFRVARDRRVQSTKVVGRTVGTKQLKMSRCKLSGVVFWRRDFRA